MLAVGVGGREGARALHEVGLVSDFSERVEASARVVVLALKSVVGVGIVEDGYGKVCELVAMKGDEIFRKEPALLEISKNNSLHLPIKSVDIALIDEIGKNIAGSGFDPNVFCRSARGVEWRNGVLVKRLVGMSLTQKSLGNALGVGLFDIVTNELADAIDWKSTAMNALSSKFPEVAALPMMADSRTSAIKLALGSLPDTLEKPKIVRVRNTSSLERFWISDTLLSVLPDSAVPTGRTLAADQALS